MRDLTRVTQWSATWNLHDNKCSAVHFYIYYIIVNHPHYIYNYSVNGKVIPFNSTHKDLGILVYIVRSTMV